MPSLAADRQAVLANDPSRAVIVMAALLMGAVAGVLVAAGLPEVGIALALAVPGATLVLRYPWAAVLLWLITMPFLVQSADASTSPGVWVIHRVLVPAMVGVTLVYRMLGLSRSHFRLSLNELAIVVFVILGFANIVLLSPNPGRLSVAFYDNLVVPMLMYWLIRLVEPRDEDLRRLVPILVGLVLVESFIGLLSWVAPSILPAAWLGRAGERAAGTFGGPGPFTVTLVFASLIILRRAVASRSRLARTVLLLAVAVGFYGVVLSFSRGSWLGATVVVAGVLVLYRRLSLQFLGLTLVLALAMAAGPLTSQFGFAADRLGDESTATSRLITDNAAVHMIQAKPLFGFGYGNFERFVDQFKERIGDIPVDPGSAHHAYLALAAENGLPALVIYLFPAAWLLLLTLRRWRLVPPTGLMNRTLLVFLWLAIADELIVSNFMDMLHSSPWGTTLWWITLGLVHVILTRASLPRQVAPARIGPLAGHAIPIEAMP